MLNPSFFIAPELTGGWGYQPAIPTSYCLHTLGT